MKVYVFSFLLLLPFLGCAANKQMTYYVDPETRAVKKVEYSPLFLGRGFLIDNFIEVYVVVVNEKKVMPVVHSLLDSMGSLPAEDLILPCTMSIHLRNNDNNAHTVVLNSANVQSQHYSIHEDFSLGGKERKISKVYTIKVDEMGLSGVEAGAWAKPRFNVTLAFEYDGVKYEKDFMVERQTTKEASGLLRPYNGGQYEIRTN